MSAHVPAWKRLGLKLKGPASGEAIPSSGGPNAAAKPSPQAPSAHQSRVNGSPTSALKRKLPSTAPAPNAVSAHTPNKKPRWEDQAANQGTPSSLNKSVSFAEGTKDKAEKKAEKKEKKAAKKKANKTPDATADTSLDPSLNYLRQWHTARESWKFNKNHQTLLIKYLFDGDRIPSADIPIFYQYIRDLKGFVRTRLRETAAEIKKADMEAGAGAFPASLKDKETKQKEYEETISRFLQDLQQHHHQSQPNDSPKNANGKRALDEVEYVLRIASPQVKHRLLKRIRAEMVLGELSDSDDSTTSTAAETATAMSTSSSSSGASGRQQQPTATTITTTATTPAATTSTRQSDGSQQPAKRRRLRNVRTAVDDDDSSSSESESSGSESDGESSSSSSEDDSEDEDMEMGGAAAGESSSSSSSSSSDGEDESDDESGEESSSSGED